MIKEEPMSYFSEFVSYPEAEVEVSKGVFIERRGFLKLSVLGLCSFLLSSNALLKGEEKIVNAENLYDLKKFVTEITPKANVLIKDEKADEEGYLKEVVELVKKIQGVEHAPKTEHRIRFTAMHDVQPIKIYQIRMLPGAVLPCHDHRDYNGIIQVLDGSANIRNYILADEKENILNGKNFKIKETANINPKKGDISSLARVRDNIHEIIAGPEGVLFLDIFTFYSSNGTSKYLNVEKTPVDEKEKLYLASWKK